MAACDLKTLQEAFSRYLLESDEKGILPHLNDTSKQSLLGQLAVYGDGYRLRLLEVIRDGFALCRKQLGGSLFDSLAYQYINTLRCHDSIIDQINGGFVPFLTAQQHPFIAEVAAIEWAISEALTAADSKRFTLTDLQEQAARGLATYSFCLHPSVRGLTLHSSAMALWQADWMQQPLPTLQPEPRQYWLLWLHDIYPTVRQLTPAEEVMISEVMAGHPFAEACEALYASLPANAVAPFAGERLQQWVNEGILARNEGL